MHLMIDNYDSFTYNIVQSFGILGASVVVRRSDQISLDEIAELKPESLIISPGPCTPSQAGVSVAAIRRFAGGLPMLGVCLGHQCISVAFGGSIRRASEVVHGKVSKVTHDGRGLFHRIPQGFAVGRYHSLVVDDLPDCIVVRAREHCTDGRDGEIMALEHAELPIWGLQFHPESVLTEHGLKLLDNYLNLVAGFNGCRTSKKVVSQILSTEC
ncbi:anthranilate synthase component 2 [Methylosinus sp. sav-2]|jgi:anthranilate synthase/aminodeoxychorismate synthase-like glutamine amidotransferase|uniref:anthranilate synthase component II n=1 Tax=unclassified Methylosinus TaxID=2624500 RepID=UPI0004B3F158|nr:MULTISPECIES: aminodeoxychorismate/anthranilate synthase component II [unclassified Methylosinus]TDX61781.1 anthranilate synthase component 2 [Methylosinus sp. sav-2]